jgi:PERQ amino acid-rich with GYF domain-containing protein
MSNLSFCDSDLVLIGVGFWDEVAPTAPKPSGKSVGGKAKPGPAGTGNNPSGKASGSKTRSKKEEALVMKLFEQNIPRGDEFTQWCSKALSGLQSSVDSKSLLKACFVCRD